MIEFNNAVITEWNEDITEVCLSPGLRLRIYHGDDSCDKLASTKRRLYSSYNVKITDKLDMNDDVFISCNTLLGQREETLYKNNEKCLIVHNTLKNTFFDDGPSVDVKYDTALKSNFNYELESILNLLDTSDCLFFVFHNLSNASDTSYNNQIDSSPNKFSEVLSNIDFNELQFLDGILSRTNYGYSSFKFLFNKDTSPFNVAKSILEGNYNNTDFDDSAFSVLQDDDGSFSLSLKVSPPDCSYHFNHYNNQKEIDNAINTAAYYFLPVFQQMGWKMYGELTTKKELIPALKKLVQDCELLKNTVIHNRLRADYAEKSGTVSISLNPFYVSYDSKSLKCSCLP